MSLRILHSSSSKTALHDAEMKRLTSSGVGSTVKQAEAFSEEQEERRWKMGILGDHSAHIFIILMLY